MTFKAASDFGGRSPPDPLNKFLVLVASENFLVPPSPRPTIQDNNIRKYNKTSKININTVYDLQKCVTFWGPSSPDPLNEFLALVTL